jgi:signal transduction histidine kinase
LTGTILERLLFTAVLIATQLAIAFYVYHRSPQRAVRASFTALGTSLAVWTAAIGMAHSRELSNVTSVRLTFMAAPILVISIVTFVSAFPGSGMPRSGWYQIFVAVGVLLAALSLTTPFVVQSSYFSNSGLSVQYGDLHPLYAAYIVTGIVTTLFIIVTKLRKASGRRRLQLRYLVLALVVPAIGIAGTNLVVPIVFGVSSWGRYGPVFSLVFLGVTAHAIMRQRLLDIRLVVGHTVAYAAAVTLSAAVFIALLSSLVRYVPAVTRLPATVQIIVAFALAVLFGPITQRLREIFDRYCYREPYDFSGTIRQVSLALSSTLELQQLLKNLFQIVDGSIKPEFVAAYLWNDEARALRLVSHNADDRQELPLSIDAASPIAVAMLSHSRKPLFRELESDMPAAAAELNSLHVDCACPIVHEGHLLAALMLGPKLSGDAYFAQDVELLASVSSHAAVAIKNAELYQRVGSLEEQRRRAERVAESGALTAGIAHEIKNPLVAIRTFAELLPDRYDDREFREQFGDVMIREIARIDKLIDRLRGLGPKPDRHRNLVDLRVPMEETLSLLAAKFEQLGIHTVKSYPNKPPLVEGSSDDLKQLFLNLLMNACEAMNQAGEISVRVFERQALGIQSIVVEITDDGPGLSDDLRDRLFHPFISTKQGSSGLGLWLSRRIADTHNAVVRGMNRTDKRGATFSVEFPGRVRGRDDTLSQITR